MLVSFHVVIIMHFKLSYLRSRLDHFYRCAHDNSLVSSTVLLARPTNIQSTKSLAIRQLSYGKYFVFVRFILKEKTDLATGQHWSRQWLEAEKVASHCRIYTSATSKDKLECRLQVCIDNISYWYSMNKLCINKKKSNFMNIGSKWQLKSFNLDDFTISVDSDKLFLARQVKYLGLWVRNDLSWEDHFLELCWKMCCNRAPWKNSVTEWFTLYKYIWNK